MYILFSFFKDFQKFQDYLLHILFSFSEIFRDFKMILTLFLLTLNNSVLIKFVNAHIFQHNGFINIDKKYLNTFSSKNWGYEKVLMRWFFEITYLPTRSVPDASFIYYTCCQRKVWSGRKYFIPINYGTIQDSNKWVLHGDQCT